MVSRWEIGDRGEGGGTLELGTEDRMASREPRWIFWGSLDGVCRITKYVVLFFYIKSSLHSPYRIQETMENTSLCPVEKSGFW